MFSIRKATTDDCLLIRNLASQIWEPTYGSILSREPVSYTHLTLPTNSRV